jgi:hypothetical protein
LFCFFLENKGEHDEAARVQHSGNAYCMAWHPVKKTLAIGFSSIKQKKNNLFSLKKNCFYFC